MILSIYIRGTLKMNTPIIQLDKEEVQKVLTTLQKLKYVLRQDKELFDKINNIFVRISKTGARNIVSSFAHLGEHCFPSTIPLNYSIWHQINVWEISPYETFVKKNKSKLTKNTFEMVDYNKTYNYHLSNETLFEIYTIIKNHLIQHNLLLEKKITIQKDMTYKNLFDCYKRFCYIDVAKTLYFSEYNFDTSDIPITTLRPIKKVQRTYIYIGKQTPFEDNTEKQFNYVCPNCKHRGVTTKKHEFDKKKCSCCNNVLDSDVIYPLLLPKYEYNIKIKVCNENEKIEYHKYRCICDQNLERGLHECIIINTPTVSPILNEYVILASRKIEDQETRKKIMELNINQQY
jgi:hypothetical protein